MKKIEKNLLIVSLGVLLGALFPLFAQPYYTRIAIDILIYAYLGAAWNILGGYTGQGSFGHAAFFGLGAYSAALFFVATKLTPWIGLLIGVAIAIGFALLMGYLSFKFGLSGHFFFLASIAFAESLRLLLNNLKAVGGSVGIYIPFTAGQFPLLFTVQSQLLGLLLRLLHPVTRSVSYLVQDQAIATRLLPSHHPNRRGTC